MATVGVLAAAGTAGALWLTDRPTPIEEFCPAYGILTDREPTTIGSQRFATGLSSVHRETSCSQPFGHYMVTVAPDQLSMTIEGHEIDGIIWDDCVISWPDGSRTSSAETDIPCSQQGT